MVHRHIKLNDHTSKRFIVIVKIVVISFKHEYTRLDLTLRCVVTDGVTSDKNTFSVINCNDLLGYDVELNLSKIYEIFKMAAILRFGRSFKPELVLEVEYNTNIGHAIPYILIFCSTF